MAKSYVFSNGDVSFHISTNYSVKKWTKYMSDTFVQKAMKEFSIYIKKEVRNRFERGISPAGRKWRKLHPATVRYRGGRGKILRMTKDLMNSIRVRLFKDTLQMTSTSVYAKMHQKGYNYKTTMEQSIWMWYNLFDMDPGQNPFLPRRVTVPPRPFMGFNKKNFAKAKGIFTRHLRVSERLGR